MSRAKIEKVMSEFKAGELRTPDGKRVTSRAQALAIALRKAGPRVNPVDAPGKNPRQKPFTKGRV